jgi:hypothetical protein
MQCGTLPRQAQPNIKMAAGTVGFMQLFRKLKGFKYGQISGMPKPFPAGQPRNTGYF